VPIITVPLGERAYDIRIEAGALNQIASLPLPEQIVVFSNTTVAPLYGEAVAESLRAVGKSVLRFDAPDGEAYKNLEWVERAYDALAEGGFTRRGAIVAVGGGVVGDWAGFVAATWMRGVPFVQVPTTLLAMVDSSVGGKTGVNHPRAKNLIGAFHQPLAVSIDPQCLGTLPPRQISAGLAEVIKYGVIADADFFDWLEANIEAALMLDEAVLQHIIARSCEIKAEVVGEDERENDANGRRATLNYGHTLGHAVEATTRYGQIFHGEAISIGMTVAAQLALQLGVIEKNEGRDLLERQTKLFRRANLPVGLPPGSDFLALWEAMKLDKKSRGDAVNFILPTKLGNVEHVSDVPAEAVRKSLVYAV